jgi:uncharacterized protein
MNQENYYQYNPWWEDKNITTKSIKREKYLNLMEDVFSKKDIVVLTGLRRVGKTTLLKDFIEILINKKHIEPKHIFYISLDDYSLGDFSILEIVREYRSLHKLKIDEKIYLFLDEITFKDNFQQQLKNLYDNQNTKIYISASSSSVLKDKKALLTGRERIIEVLPLDFNEYLLFKNIKIENRNAYLKKTYFEEYLQIGGMPEYVLTNDRAYLNSLIEDIIQKDIIAYHNIKNKQLIKDFFILLMERAGKQVSINKLAKILSISPDTAKRYLSLFEETYLINLVSRFGHTNSSILSPKKVYASDLGIKNFFTGFRDKGAIFENYVYLLIKKFNPKYIYENGIEIDFITENQKLIEVKYENNLNEKQKSLYEKTKAKEKYIFDSIDSLDIIGDWDD